MTYAVHVVRVTGATARIGCNGRNVDFTAVRESKRRAVAHAEVWFGDNWICTYVNGRRAFGASDR